MRRRWMLHTAGVTLGALALAGWSSAALAATNRPSHKQSTTLSISASRKAVTPGSSDAISGQLRSGKSGVAKQTVDLEGRSAGHNWAMLARAATRSNGSVGFTVKPDQTEQYRLLYPGSANYDPSQSGVVTVEVSRPTSLSIHTAKTLVTSKSSDTISGVLSSGKTPLPAEKVELVADGSNGKSAVIATGTTDRHGGVKFSVKPSDPTNQYQLVFAGAPGYQPTQSMKTTVYVV
jgi:hypothetical protein